VAVIVDDLDNVLEIDAAARDKGVRVRVLIEVDVGMGRAGILHGDPTVDFARRIAACQGVELAGLQCWESGSLRIIDPEEKRRTILEDLRAFTDSADQCRQAGIPMEILSCGGTGTFAMAAFAPGITEIEAGGGIYGDLQYTDSFNVPGLECALFVRSTVTSHAVPTRFVCDAGKKTMSNDATEPQLIGIGGVAALALSAEHGIVTLEEPSERPKVGEQVEFKAGYSDTTVVLHDEMFGIRDGVVEVVWSLLGRGRLQ
jgi:D-serine deaminase-like pyridoxal phosphate-dependent protein